eukprot:scaffold2267_cov112-Isochrysis_galbana.AAC.1
MGSVERMASAGTSLLLCTIRACSPHPSNRRDAWPNRSPARQTPHSEARASEQHHMTHDRVDKVMLRVPGVHGERVQPLQLIFIEDVRVVYRGRADGRPR